MAQGVRTFDVSIFTSAVGTTSDAVLVTIFKRIFSSGERMSEPPLFVRVRRLTVVPDPLLRFLQKVT